MSTQINLSFQWFLISLMSSLPTVRAPAPTLDTHTQSHMPGFSIINSSNYYIKSISHTSLSSYHLSFPFSSLNILSTLLRAAKDWSH